MSNFKKPTMIRILNSLSIDMVKIPNKNYMMGKYPITIAEYMHFVKDTNSHHPEWLEKGSKYHIKTETDDRYKKMDLSENAPIIGVSWRDGVAYAKWLSEKTGDIYRLPTEAEWEYSCRAGTTTKWSFGDDEKELTKYAWYDKNSDNKTHPVGKKLPNPWGLYDMHGNVWEWCEDWYDKDKRYKVLRGGSWNYFASLSRSSFRFRSSPGYRFVNGGFRLLRVIKGKGKSEK